jgi:hypothetical protein
MNYLRKYGIMQKLEEKKSYLYTIPTFSPSEPPPDVGSVGSFSAPEPGGSSNNCAGMPVRRYSTARSGLLKLARKACSTYEATTK